MIAALVLAAAAAGAALPAGPGPEALHALEQRARRHPRSSRLAAELGAAYEQAGRPAEAVEAFGRAVASNPSGTAAALRFAALVAASPARWELVDAALVLLERSLARVPAAGRLELSLRIAELERSVGRTPQARARLLALSAEAPASPLLPRLREALDRLDQDERARAWEAWPQPVPTPAQESALGGAEAALRSDRAREALAAATSLVQAQPTWAAARFVRARALSALGRVDEAARELRVVTQLLPAHARAWRLLGETLAQHGGLLEADAADDALRRALALEPSWTELWLLRAQVALRLERPLDVERYLQRLARAGEPSAEAGRLLEQARAQAAAGAPLQPAARVPPPEPTPQARALLADAQAAAASAAPELAAELVRRALLESPGYLDAAVAFYALTGLLPGDSLRAFDRDADGLLELEGRLRGAGAPAALTLQLLDRAVALGAADGAWRRALVKQELGDREGALADLTLYAASPQPLHLDEARVLRARLVAAPRDDGAQRQAWLKLAEDRPEAARAVLGGSCTPGLDARRLLSLGEVAEYAGEREAAVDCYRLAAARDPRAAEPLFRLSRLAARNPEPRAEPELLRAAATFPQALWALARLDLMRGRSEAALQRIEGFLARAEPDEPEVPAARAAREALLQHSRDLARARGRARALAAGAGLLVFALAALFLWAGASVARALRRRPRLFPAVARAVAELRHDVLKHRASVLGMLEEPAVVREDVARALLSPEPASLAVRRTYDGLRDAARAQGVSLRRLGREPVFGPLVRDLSRAEALLQAPAGGESELRAIEARLRERHGPALAGLLRLGPRTRVDASAVAGWIRDVEAELRRGGGRWTPPSIALQAPQLEFPVDPNALATIVSNLLRNAQSAAGALGRVSVRLGEERDAAGQRLLSILVGDDAGRPLDLAAIESRESGRGLAIVRDLTREWQGHLVIRSEEPPWTKAIGALFPAPPA